MTKTPKLSGFLRPGSVVEFLQDNEAHIAWVLEEASDRLRLLTRTRREVKLPASRLLPWSGPEYPPGATREEIQHRLEALEARRREIMAEVNALDLWDMAQGEVERAPVEWFATLLWQEPGPNELAAVGRALVGAKTHFKFQPPDFEIHPADKVEARLMKEREDKEREGVATAGHAILGALWGRIKSGQPPLSPHAILPEAEGLDPEVEARLREMLLAQVAGRSSTGNEHDALAKLWESLKKPLPDAPHLALQLAQAWGVLPPHHNHLLDEAGYAWGDAWTAAFAGEINAQLARFAELAAAAEVDPTPYVSIDAATTKDIDDAFFVRRTELPDGGAGFHCAVALARPTLTWEFGSALDREVMHRVTSLYLPEGSGHMMPEALGTGLFSLTAGAAKPALVAEFLIDEQGGVQSATPRLAWIKVARNIAYPDAQAALDAGPQAPAGDAHLSLAMGLARALFERRLERGAVVIDRPEPCVELEGEGLNARVRIETRAACPDAELLVSEFMILANCGLAGWAREAGVPLLHRTQDIALPPSATGVFRDPVDIFRVVKLLAPPALECTPRRHAALACEAYATLTSPIRRYVDFLNMAQIQEHLASGQPRLDRAGLEALIPHLSARIQEVGQIQRFRPRYWKLAYLAQNRREPFQAVVVDELGPYPTLALPDLQLQVRLPRHMLGDKIHPGMPVTVLFGRIDPLANELKVLEAREGE